MRKTRKIIEIDEDLCDGCGSCIISCAEGALALVGGKAKLVGEVYCDGLGACIGDCPRGALKIAERPADEFDACAAEERKAGARPGPGPAPAAPGGRKRAAPCCPSAAPAALRMSACADPGSEGSEESRLGHWPVKLALLGPGAPFLEGADLVLLADCAAAAFPGLHAHILPGRVIAMGCPKLDNLDAHVETLAGILAGSGVKSLAVVHMEVPCCFGFVHAAREAVSKSGRKIPLSRMKISRDGRIIEKEAVA